MHFLASDVHKSPGLSQSRSKDGQRTKRTERRWEDQLQRGVLSLLIAGDDGTTSCIEHSIGVGGIAVNKIDFDFKNLQSIERDKQTGKIQSTVYKTNTRLYENGNYGTVDVTQPMLKNMFVGSHPIPSGFSAAQQEKIFTLLRNNTAKTCNLEPPTDTNKQRKGPKRSLYSLTKQNKETSRKGGLATEILFGITCSISPILLTLSPSTEYSQCFYFSERWYQQDKLE
ncbi:uncharacterized protein LOC131383878 [Hylobates moloch]|uniref:uncharacterized protein LOC131383878 n=1 Tax=Hylobates moloch TaxID=81572 RepID=UPI002674A0EA|nr:uncharacterized protein LOC131383878 [Hylobates moloch]